MGLECSHLEGFLQRRGLKAFPFPTNTSTKRVAQFLENEKARLYFYDSLGPKDLD